MYIILNRWRKCEMRAGDMTTTGDVLIGADCATPTRHFGLIKFIACHLSQEKQICIAAGALSDNIFINGTDELQYAYLLLNLSSNEGLRGLDRLLRIVEIHFVHRKI